MSTKTNHTRVLVVFAAASISLLLSIVGCQSPSYFLAKPPSLKPANTFVEPSLLSEAVMGLVVPANTVSQDEPPVKALVERRFQLYHIRPYFGSIKTRDHQVLALLESDLSEHGQFQYIRKSNEIVVRDTVEALETISQMLQILDYPGLPLPPGILHLPFKYKADR